MIEAFNKQEVCSSPIHANSERPEKMINETVLAALNTSNQALLEDASFLNIVGLQDPNADENKVTHASLRKKFSGLFAAAAMKKSLNKNSPLKAGTNSSLKVYILHEHQGE